METENTKALDCKDLCVIIEACAKHGVQELKYLGLELKMGTQTHQGAEVQTSPGDNAAPNPPVVAMTEKDHQANTDRVLAEEEVLTREEQFAELIITNPLAAEKMLQDGELDDADDERGDDGNRDDE